MSGLIGHESTAGRTSPGSTSLQVFCDGKTDLLLRPRPFLLLPGRKFSRKRKRARRKVAPFGAVVVAGRSLSTREATAAIVMAFLPSRGIQIDRKATVPVRKTLTPTPTPTPTEESISLVLRVSGWRACVQSSRRAGRGHTIPVPLYLIHSSC